MHFRKWMNVRTVTLQWRSFKKFLSHHDINVSDEEQLRQCHIMILKWYGYFSFEDFMIIEAPDYLSTQEQALKKAACGREKVAALHSHSQNERK